MNRVLVDTNVLSYQLRGHSLANRYSKHILGRQAFIAAQTVAEMRFGALNANWGTRRSDALELLLSQYTALYPNDLICTLWAQVLDMRFKAGRPVEEADAWIAATALAFEIPLVTHNVKDFDFVPNLTLILEQP